jgi:RNA polymerase sigma-70 factor (ECF subfamily)
MDEPTTPDDPAESRLLERAQAGDHAAFETVLRPHLPMLLAYSRAICGDFHRAQDVVQETALVAFRNLGHLFPEADFASWLKAIARRQSLAARRKAGRLATWTDEAIEAAYADPTPRAVGPERDALVHCVEALEPQPRSIVRGHYFDGQALAGLAAAMDLNLNTVKTILHRARLKLLECVERRLRVEGAR